MKPQKVFREDKKTVVKREKEKKALFERIYDIKNNPEMRVFQRAYNVFSVLFCVFLVVMLLTGVSQREGLYREISRDVIRPSAEECARNGRAKSTKMRWAIRA